MPPAGGDAAFMAPHAPSRPMRGLPVVLGLLLLLASAPSAAAATTKSCELVPRGFLVGGSTNGCSVSNLATQEVRAVVHVTGGTIDAIEIDMAGPAGERHAFVCTFTVQVSSCVLPVQAGPVDGVWTVTARIVAADPLGPVVFGSIDTYARLEATFV